MARNKIKHPSTFSSHLTYNCRQQPQSGANLIAHHSARINSIFNLRTKRRNQAAIYMTRSGFRRPDLGIYSSPGVRELARIKSGRTRRRRRDATPHAYIIQPEKNFRRINCGPLLFTHSGGIKRDWD